MAIAAPGRPPADQYRPTDRASSAVLARLLEDAARVSPDRPAFRDGPGREEWCGRPSFELSCEIGAEAVSRLASYLAGLGLDRHARVGICLPNGSEAALSILAVGKAGLTPCLMDVMSTAGELSSAIETADVRAVITQARFGPDRPAEKLCFVAAGFFRLRFLLAFGPSVPDGVVDLDPILLEPRRDIAPRSPASYPDEVEPGLVSFARGGGGKLASFRSYRSLIAAAAPTVRAAKLRPGERLLTLLPPDDLKGLATGLLASLVAGATAEMHAAVTEGRLRESLAGSVPTHLVAPGWMEPGIAELLPGSSVLSMILVHEPPTELQGRPETGCRTVDVLCCSEMALLSGVRSASGRIDLPTLCGAQESGGDPSLLEVRIEGDQMQLRGAAVAWPDRAEPDVSAWQSTGLLIERTGAEITGIA